MSHIDAFQIHCEVKTIIYKITCMIIMLNIFESISLIMQVVADSGNINRANVTLLLFIRFVGYVIYCILLLECIFAQL